MAPIGPSLAGALLLLPVAAVAQGSPTPLLPPGVTYPDASRDQPAPLVGSTPLLLPDSAEPEPATRGAQSPGPAPSPELSSQADQPSAALWPNKWVPAGMADIQVLNKINAASQKLAVKVGQTVEYDSLSIQVQACVVRPSDQPADAAALLVITDGHKDEPGFKGWSLAHEPWVSMLQNPVYNVRLVGCS